MKACDPHTAPLNLPAMPRMGVVAAFRWEVKDLLRRSREAKRLRRGLCFLRLEGEPVILAVAGAGARDSFAAAQRLLENFPLRSLLSVGFAGALAESLSPGDVLVAESVVEEATGERFACRTDLLPVRSSHLGTLLCCGNVATSAAEKRRLGRHWEAAAADMESAGVARAAALAGIPFSAVKSVTDGCEESIAIDFHRCWSDDGELSLFRILREGLTTWRGSRDLYRLARSSRQAAGSLAAALGSL